MDENGYEVGSLLWIEKNEAIAYRAILESVISGELSIDAAREALECMDTDTVR